MDGHNQLKIQPFIISNMCTDPAITMIAKRGSGKSWVVRDIMRNQKNIPGGIVISPTEKLNHFYSGFVPDIYIYDKYRSEIVEQLFKRQDIILEKLRKRTRICIKNYSIQEHI